MKRLITLTIAIVLSLTLQACSFGGHSVNVVKGHNNCATVACNQPNTRTTITIH